MKTLLLFFACACLVRAGDTLLAKVTGTDETVCELYKVSGSVISLGLTCTLDGQILSPAEIKTTSVATGFSVLSQGQVMIFIGINPTNAPVSFGAMGTAPAAGIAYAAACGVGCPVTMGTATW